ncbi:MAG: type II secretion system protein GspJ [Bdellovibrionales bacterium]
MKNHGFTLIEVVIAMMILAFLSLFTVQALRNALKTKSKVQKEIDKNALLRDALRVMERDINKAFNYRDPNIKLYNLAQKHRQTAANKPKQQDKTGDLKNPNPQPTPTPQPAAGPTDPNKFKPKEEKVLTHFIGEPESLDFTALSNVRLTEDSPISDQAEIGYKIKPCRRRSSQEQSSKCLWRRVSNYIHEDITKEGEETVLLENVNEFKLRYLGPGRDDEWVDTWITNERGDDLTKNKFPYAVEITVEIRDPDPKAKDKSLRMTTVAAIRNPNNEKEKKPEEEQQQNGNPTPQPQPQTGANQ